MKLHSRVSSLLLPAAAALLLACSAATAGEPVADDHKSAHFDAVAKHLDLGGVFYAYVDVDGDVERLADLLNQLLETVTAAGENVAPQLAQLDVKAVVNDLGITGVEAAGLSSYKNGELYRNKMYLHIPEGRKGLLEITGGEPAPFAAKSLAPAGTDLLMEMDLDLNSGFQLARTLVRKIGGAEAAREFARATGRSMGKVNMTVAEIFGRLDTKLMVIGRIHPDKPMKLPEKVPMEVPGVDLLISLDKVGPLFRKLVASIPDEERAQLLKEGDGFRQVNVPVPPEVQAIVQPVIRHDMKTGRVLAATSEAFLTECLSSETSLWDDDNFKQATAELPEEGNGISFISAEFMKEYLRVYGDLFNAMQAQGAPPGLGEFFVGFMNAIGFTENHSQASVFVNLPEGILMVENAGGSHKEGLVAAGVGGAAFLGGVVFQTRRVSGALGFPESKEATPEPGPDPDSESGDGSESPKSESAPESRED